MEQQQKNNNNPIDRLMITYRPYLHYVGSNSLHRLGYITPTILCAHKGRPLLGYSVGMWFMRVCAGEIICYYHACC